jgi:pantetheine-phosphate adenylyltransferase
VLRSLALFDEVIIGIGYNSTKKNRYFDIELMVEKIEEVYKDTPNVSVVVYNELTSTLAKKYDAQFLVRGLRNTTDFEYENTISQMNRYLNGKLDTVFLITAPQYAAISSTVIREVHRYGGNVDEFLPYSL